MTPRKAGRRKSGKGRGVKAWAVMRADGDIQSSLLLGNIWIFTSEANAVDAAKPLKDFLRVVPCEIVIGRK